MPEKESAPSVRCSDRPAPDAALLGPGSPPVQTECFPPRYASPAAQTPATLRSLPEKSSPPDLPPGGPLPRRGYPDPRSNAGACSSHIRSGQPVRRTRIGRPGGLLRPELEPLPGPCRGRGNAWKPPVPRARGRKRCRNPLRSGCQLSGPIPPSSPTLAARQQLLVSADQRAGWPQVVFVGKISS